MRSAELEEQLTAAKHDMEQIGQAVKLDIQVNIFITAEKV